VNPADPICLVMEVKRGTELQFGFVQILGEIVVAAKSNGGLPVNGVFTDGFLYYFLRLENGVLYYSVDIEERDTVFALLEVALAGGDVFEAELTPPVEPSTKREETLSPGGEHVIVKTTTTTTTTTTTIIPNPQKKLNFDDEEPPKAPISLDDEEDVLNKSVDDLHMEDVPPKPAADLQKKNQTTKGYPSSEEEYEPVAKPKPKPALPVKKRAADGKRKREYDSDTYPAQPKRLRNLASPNAKQIWKTLEVAENEDEGEGDEKVKKEAQGRRVTRAMARKNLVATLFAD